MERYIAAGLLLVGIVGVSTAARADDEARPAFGPRRVLAFYYAWYGNPEVSGHWKHWEKVRADRHDIASATHYPCAGAYDSADPKIIDQHMRMMADVGIDGPILSWWGQKAQDSDHITDQLLKAAARHGRVVSAYFETIRGDDHVASAAAALAYLVSRYGRVPAWLKVGDRPVIFIYGRAVGQMGSIERWREVRARVRKETGVEPFLIGDRIASDAAAVFDGIHIYNPVSLLAGRSVDQMKRQNLRAANLTAALARSAGKLACMTIIPGYDDTKIRNPGLACSRHDGDTYKAGWEASLFSGCDWVLITSWNEWHEGSEIEPSLELGERDWKATRIWAGRFRTGTPPSSAAPLDATWRDYVARWKAGTIGLLDVAGESAVAVDLLSCGLPHRLVSLRDVASGKVTPRDCPILLYLGGEAVSTEFGPGATLEAGLKQFQHAGGVLVLASWEPWPFHRSLETGETGWLQHLGMRLGGGFEKPPGSGLRFQFKGALRSFGERPFPTGGDLRFRPCIEESDEGTRVDVLAVLRAPDGHDFGPAIAVLHRREPVPARMIYVWERMWDVVDRDALLRAILDQATVLRTVRAAG